MTLEEMYAELESLEAAWAQQSLKFFILKTWHLVEPTVPFVDNWHIDELCNVLEAVTRGELERVIINEPSGTSKSLIISVFWPAWEWANDASLRYLTASYGSHLTIRDNLRVRDIVNSEWYQKHYGVAFVGDQNVKEFFKTTDGGWRFATSVGGAGTGEHPDRIVIDDPLTAAQARSKEFLSRATEWFDNTVSSRGVTRDVRIVVIMQRLHVKDLTGHLLGKGGWEHVCWPMRYEPFRPKTDQDAGHTPDKRDPRTEPGALFWPSLFPERKVRQLEIDLGPYGAAGQLQQRPAPEGGGLFKREWFKFVQASPRRARRARGWDTAGTEEDGDYTAGVRIAEANDLFYVEHVVRGQFSPAGVDSVMKLTAELDTIDVVQREEKEPGASGKAVVGARSKLLKGYDYKFVATSGDKVTRAKPYRAQCEAGNVYLVRTGDPVLDAWIEPYIAELCSFPTGDNDDQVDGSSASFNAVLLEPIPDDNMVWGR